jgi:hypothetical protein
MDQRFDTSFIPQRPIFKEEASMRRHEPIPVVTIISAAIFFAMLIMTGLAFYFHKKESAAVTQLATQLATEKEKFNPQAIEDLKAIGARLQLAKQAVDNHVGVTGLLNMLQANTLKSVYYKGMNLSREEKKGYIVTLQGDAPNFGILYAQLEEFRKNPRITQVSIDNSQLEEQTGVVGFNLTLTLSPEVMKYVVPPLAQETLPITQTGAQIPQQ